MAVYVGKEYYYDLFDLKSQNVDLTVRLFQIDVNNIFTSAISDPSQDLEIIPTIWFDNLIQLSSNQKFNTCKYLLNVVRTVKLYVTTTNYLRVILPFKPGSDTHLLFFQQAKDNLKIVNIRTDGERHNDDLLRFYATRT